MGKNVLQFIPSFHQGGSERQAVQLTKLLLENGEYQIFTATLNRSGTLLEEIEKAGVKEIYEFRLKSFFDTNFLKEIRRCSKFLKQHKIDIVQTHDFYTNIFGMLSAKFAGVSHKIATKRETEGVRTEMQKRIERYVFKIADSIVVNSEAVKKYLVDGGVRAEKISVVYNGVDVDRLTPKLVDREKICSILGLPLSPELKYITHVANLRHDVKNQEMLLRAAKSLNSEFPNVNYVFAGEGDRSETLQKMACDLEIDQIVHFIGRCASVPELLSISYACVLTSTAEGFSNSILEYMNAGKPVVATNVGGASEVIVEGETGFLVESDDDRQLAMRLGDLLRDEQKASRLGSSGRERIQKGFSTAKQLKDTLKLYKAG